MTGVRAIFVIESSSAKIATVYQILNSKPVTKLSTRKRIPTYVKNRRIIFLITHHICTIPVNSQLKSRYFTIHAHTCILDCSHLMVNQTQTQKPFNLLYKFEPQKSSIDKLYDFVTKEGRYIVVMVMFVIIVAFIYRFPLDRKLNDEINRSTRNLREIKFYSESGEKTFKDILQRTQGVKNFLDIYPDTLDIHSKTPGQIKSNEILRKVKEISDSYKNDIVITDYLYTADPIKGSSLHLTGATSTFTKVEEFRDKIRTNSELVNEVYVTNLGSTKSGTPKFALDIKIKDSIQ